MAVRVGLLRAGYGTSRHQLPWMLHRARVVLAVPTLRGAVLHQHHL